MPAAPPADPATTNWLAILDRLADDADRLRRAYDDPVDLETLLLAGVGRTPPTPGSPLPEALRAYAEQVLAAMAEVERRLAATATRLAADSRDQPATPAYYVDTKA